MKLTIETKNGNRMEVDVKNEQGTIGLEQNVRRS